MLKIAHRGNTNGPTAHENQLWYVQEAIDRGYDAEIDIWMIGDRLWAGHDAAQFLVREEFLAQNRSRLWIHCKNFKALDYFVNSDSLFNYFWHQGDDFTLTSSGHIWTYPEKDVGKNSVIVDLDGKKEYNCYAICSDYFA